VIKTLFCFSENKREKLIKRENFAKDDNKSHM